MFKKTATLLSCLVLVQCHLDDSRSFRRRNADVFSFKDTQAEIDSCSACPDSYCNYGSGSYPHDGICHGSANTPCSCLNCFDENACKDAPPSPTPSPTPTPPTPSPTPSPTPTPSIPCATQSDCPTDYVCCRCSCGAGDTIYGDFDCNCYKGKPTTDQPNCCGGTDTFPPHAWCAKRGTKSAKKPTCSNQTISGMPTPLSDFYEYGMNMRCVKDRCNAGFCDNPKPAVVPYYGDNDTYVGEFTCARG